jgi:hypothetical protein
MHGIIEYRQTAKNKVLMLTHIFYWKTDNLSWHELTLFKEYRAYVVSNTIQDVGDYCTNIVPPTEGHAH